MSSALEWAQAILKTLSCAVMGFSMLVMYWKTRNVWAIGLVHALFDFLTGMKLVLGATANLGAGNYVLEGDAGIAGIVIMGLQTPIGALIALRVWKKVGKTIDFEAMRESW